MTSSTSSRTGTSLRHVIQAEILSVTSTMRRNSRWASSTVVIGHRGHPRELGSDLGLRLSSPAAPVHQSGRGSKEAELMANFVELQRTIQNIPDVAVLDLGTLLAPFLAIIRSPLSTGPITSSALSALHSFFVCGIIRPDASEHLNVVLAELSNTISHCRFEASDSSGDEVVLLKLMTVIEDFICNPVGGSLGDVEVCELLEAVLTTCCQPRLSGTLRRSAENTMHNLVRTVFRKLNQLDPETEEAKLKSDEAETEGELKMTVQSSTEAVQETQTEEPVEGSPEATNASEAPASEQDQGQENQPQQQPEQPSSTTVPQEEEEPTSAVSFGKKPEYGLPSLIELLRVIINVLDPTAQQHTDSIRLIALGILNAAFDEAGCTISKFPSLRVLITDPGCKYLFQLARSENNAILHLSLRTIFTILDCMKKDLKLQQELLLTFTIDRLYLPPARLQVPARRGATSSPRPGTPSIATPPLGPSDEKADTPRRVPPARGEIRDYILETLSHLVHQPNFMVDIYANYDCDTNCENLFEKLIEFLTKAVYPAQGLTSLESQRNTQYLCLEMLLAFVNDMANRANANTDAIHSLLQAKSRKELISAGATKFNTKPKTGVAFLEENGFIYQDLSPEVSKPQSLAKFLKSCGRLDKRVLGGYISKPDNIELLKAFIGLFDFKGKDVADALRDMLEAFRLPGESQQISRITEVFSSIYFATGPEEIKSEDACYVLAYSVIMLNTDLHNAQVRKRMSVEDYKKNLRGVNEKTDFSSEYLTKIYESIKKEEIVMPEEHSGQVGFEYAWKELLTRSRQAGDFVQYNTSVFDVEMFKAVWKPVISAIAYAFITFDDDYIIQRAVAGFRQCATLAGRFNLPDVFDFVVISLSQATGLLSESLPAQVPNYPIVEVEGQSVTVSKLSVEFGTNFKGQLAAVVLFNIVNGNGNALREGWTQIFEMFQNLFLHSLLPTRMLQMEDFLGGFTMIPLRGSQPQPAQSRGDGGLLSTLSSYLMTPYSSSEAQVPDATDADVENTLCTIDCITSCRLDEFYSQITQIDSDAMVAAVRALEALAHERTVAKLRLHSEDNLTALDDPPYKLPYDPASVFLLETMASIACQAPQFIEELWPVIFEHISALLSSAAQYSILLIERAVVCLLRLCQILAYNPSLRDQIYVSLDLLARIHPSVSSSVGDQVVAGLIVIMQKHPNIVRSQTEWNLVFALLRNMLSHPEAARLTFELTSNLAGEGPDADVSLDNFAGLVTILDDFASAAGALVEAHTRQSRRRVEPLTAANSVPVERGKKSVEYIAAMLKRLPELLTQAQVAPPEAWKHFTLPLLSSLARQSVNASREIRHVAISQLQRILLGPALDPGTTDQSQVEDVFNRVVFPLIDDLLKPQVYQRDPQGMSETRLRASALLCKSFMHLEVREEKMRTDFRLLWIQILDLLDRLMIAGRDDQLNEAVPESLKNVLLVMNAVGILVPPAPEGEEQDQLRKTLWTATHERLERFLPGFLQSVIAPPQAPIP
ncbi:Sec7 domain-containing protein [Coprinopsis cinerea okayama7|uniref:Sec7 domain-containing protein n=1 Tax=Coprinopsis cinerea (strain Okayama-7 / 130 / ATCC MYA-4618 / FGSC 9003) TaxID=240176 RepID=A8NG37_COPC7|nr:Sec7 domain-containing protein [Coprinopsis cinerea okayama7\|eukprot:XP_001833466.2 Sec7 domain-containing protein [Coprinopsis cinerea okayama7\